MTPLFADTFYYLARVSRNDAAREKAVALAEATTAQVITTTWFLTEVGDALAAPRLRPVFLRLLHLLRTDSRTTIVRATEDLFAKGVDLYRQRPDKEWSLTDCISFVVMSERGISDALTADHHFQQAGFRALMK
jgi:predicted nucleic acid-binding protein